MPQKCSSLASKFGGHHFGFLMAILAASDIVGFYLVWHSFSLSGYGFYLFSCFFHQFLFVFVPRPPISSQCADFLLGILPPPLTHANGWEEDSQVCISRPDPQSHTLWAASTHVSYRYLRLTVSWIRSCLMSGSTTGNTFLTSAEPMPRFLKMPT